jgi:hypothetical protein
MNFVLTHDALLPYPHLVGLRRRMKTSIGIALLVLGTAAAAFGAVVPEIDPASGGSALALLAGALVIIQGRRKR